MDGLGDWGRHKDKGLIYFSVYVSITSSFLS